MAAVGCALSEDQLLCAICLETFTDPVSTTCGHSFCSICINKHWDNCSRYHCPMCKELFPSRPKLKTNICLSEMVSEFRNRPQSEHTGGSGAADVLCDVCPELKLKALKSCLVCQKSYCSVHLTPHNTKPHLRKHQLIAPLQNPQDRICPEHNRIMELFCRDHSQLICVQCSQSAHHNHKVVSLKEQCKEQQSGVQQNIQERQKKIQQLQRSVELSQKNADRETKKGVKFFNDLMKSVQESLDEFKQSINEKHQETKTEAEELIREARSEISVLEQRGAQMEEMWKSNNHFGFVHTFTLVKPAPELQDWTGVSVREPSYEGRAAAAVSELQSESFNPKLKELFESELKQAKKYAVNVTLDPLSAHPDLVVSKGRKQVRYTFEELHRPRNRRRFSSALYVCGKQKFSSGKFYFEVEVEYKRSWWIGVVEESADRNEDPDKMTTEDGFFEMSREDAGKDRCCFPETVGVFVDYDEGLIFFFDADSTELIYSFTDCCFNGNILPLLSPGDEEDNPMILTPV